MMSLLTLAVLMFGSESAEAELQLPAQFQSVHIGVTSKLTLIEAIVPKLDDPASAKKRVLLVGSFEPQDSTATTITSALGKHTEVSISAVRNPFPNGLPEAIQFPPPGNAYQLSARPEAHYLWRWIGIQGFDLVIHLRSSAKDGEFDSPLVTALAKHSACNVGVIPGIGIEGSSQYLLSRISDAVKSLESATLSAAHAELVRRHSLSPLDTARLLAKRYGHKLSSVAYIPGVAMSGRLRLAELDSDKDVLSDVVSIARPWLSKSPLASKPNGPNLAGHLIFGDLARLSNVPDADRKAFRELVIRAANTGFDNQGNSLSAVPGHNEMSDSFFMVCPVLAQAGKLTGETRYFDMALRHFRFMRKLCLRPDGLYRHSPLDESPWGRGNGFVALGLALTLHELPTEHPAHAELLNAFREHLQAMAKYQDYSGMWHQVVDYPGSYREFSGTCMTSFAIVRGIRSGWLTGGNYDRVIQRSWNAIKLRIGDDASVVDICTGTGKQKDLKAYLNRQAILGRDDRGGAMALLFATEMASWRRERQ